MLEFDMNASFANKDGFNFFLVQKFISPGHYVPIYKSEIKPCQGQYFSWAKFSALTSSICKEENDREIRVDFYKSSKSGKHVFLGFSTFTLEHIKGDRSEFEITGKGGKYKVGEMKLRHVQIAKRHTFLEYVFGGCDINLVCAIDFTLSNGDPKDRDSLHYFDMNKNEYLQAISSVGQILQYYDSDKKIPVFGFGAKVPPVTHRASHCFALNGDIFDPEVDGLDGVIEAYQNSLQNVQLYGPTHFSEVLKLVVDMAQSERVNQMN